MGDQKRKNTKTMAPKIPPKTNGIENDGKNLKYPQKYFKEWFSS